jgi:uncharacterized protein YutD
MIFMAGGNAYSLFHEHKSGWNPEAFRERFSEVLERFDYIVGDWGYNQLRLRGFYRDGHPRATKESTISSIVDYINEYCNFGCAYFVLLKLDSNALPPDAVIMKEDTVTPETLVALNESEEQEAETAATAAPPIVPVMINGQIMRWPIKERVGGPVRAPNVTVSAVARAAADAERRNAMANAGGTSANSSSGASSQTRGSHSRQGQDNGNTNNRQGRAYNGPSGSGDRRQQPQGQGGSSAKPYPPRNIRPQGNDQANKTTDETLQADNGSNRNEHSRHENSRGEASRGDASRNDNRWSSKNRRRKSYGGKPTQRPDGAPRSVE